MMLRLLFAVLLAWMILIATGCRRAPEGEVILYVSADDYVVREVVERFEKETGIRVRVVGDTEAAKNTGLAERILAEKDRPQADVFWSSEVFFMVRLADAGVLEAHDSDQTREWPGPRDEQRRWHGFGARARVIVYGTDRLRPEEVPTTWMGLTQERWRGRVAMADPRFGTTLGHLGAMQVFWDSSIMPGYFEAFLEGLVANNVQVLPTGNAGVVRAVASGEADLGMTDTDDVWAAMRQGLKVDLVYPRHAMRDESGGGTLLIPNTAARVKGGPNPEQARLLVDFLLSEQVERLLVESDSHNVPVRESVAREYPQYAVPDPLRIDFQRVERAMDKAVRRFMELHDGGGS